MALVTLQQDFDIGQIHFSMNYSIYKKNCQLTMLLVISASILNWRRPCKIKDKNLWFLSWPRPIKPYLKSMYLKYIVRLCFTFNAI